MSASTENDLNEDERLTEILVKATEELSQSNKLGIKQTARKSTDGKPPRMPKESAAKPSMPVNKEVTESKEDIPSKNDSEPTDAEIVKYGVKKLKEFIKKNDSMHAAIACNKEKSIGIDKDELRFMALDSKPSGWTKERLINLRPQCRKYLIAKIKSYAEHNHIEALYNELDCMKEEKIDLFINEEKSKQREEIIDDFLPILKEISDQEKQNKAINNASKTECNVEKHGDDDDEEKKQRQMLRNQHDEMSSVSTHPSMPRFDCMLFTKSDSI